MPPTLYKKPWQDHVVHQEADATALINQQAEREALDEFFRAAGCERWEPGCSMCLPASDFSLKEKV
jgi:homoaconitase/3-isopropylmalate dehydratase large subunit